MTISQLTITNRAAMHLGQMPITQTQLTNDEDKIPVLSNDLYSELVDEQLRAFDWHWASRRQQLVEAFGFDSDDALTITGATKADPVVITCTNTWLADGMNVYIDDITGMTELNGNVYRVANRDATSFELYGIDGSNYTTYVSGGECYRKSPMAKYANGYCFTLPADLLVARTIGRDGNGRLLPFELIREDQDYLYTAETDEPILRYTFDASSAPTTWSQLFVEMVAVQLAIRMCPAVLGTGTKGDRKLQSLKSEYALQRALALNEEVTEQEVDQDEVESNVFLNARRR